MRSRGHRRWAARACAAILVVPVLAGCSGSVEVDAGPDADRADRPSATDWSPRPTESSGLRVLAESDADGFRLHTASGDKTFLPGVNLGSSTPLHQPGEVNSITAADYRRWLAGMGRLGIRVVRVYTLHPPAFYDELARYNEAHPAAPLYLVQGAYLPDEDYLRPGRSLYDERVDAAFASEIADVSDAVHGALERPAAPGRAGGRYTSDVSRWLLGWVIGVEWDPVGVRQTDRVGVDRPSTETYFAATAGATPTERWIAGHLDDLAGREAARGISVPIAFVNWPTTDPLTHPDEPLPSEDLVGVDANHVLPTDAWPGGTFASFHAYPYYPDFLRHEAGLSQERWTGTQDPYAGYLVALQEHFADHMPLLVTEFGVPSSLGSAHAGTRGRDQGGHSEQEALAMTADMMRMMQGKGIGGAFVFAWTDEWFKRTWNTVEHQDPERRQLWHDPLTNEQWFGLVATDPEPVVDAAAEATPEGGAFSYLHTWADASYVQVELALRGRLPDVLRVEADALPGPEGADYRITVDRSAEGGAGTAVLEVRRELDPLRLDTTTRPYHPDAAEAWHLYRLMTNRERRHDGTTYPAEFQDVGALVRGTWDPTSHAYDSRATWQVDEDRRLVRLRVPWSMLGLADPSSHLALGEGVPAERVPIDALRFSFVADGAAQSLELRWPDWNHTRHRERLKAGSGVLADAYRDLAP